MDKEFNKGIKTFFICPDKTIMPEEDYLKVFLLLGYEVHYLVEDKLLSIEDHIDCLVKLFKELIIFINIENKIIKSRWKSILEKISLKHSKNLKIGVLHQEIDDKKRQTIENYCLFDLGIQAGCILLENNAQRNIEKINMILEVNEANGRRKVVRASCFGRFNFILKDKKYEGKIIDISISHFLAVFTNSFDHVNIKESEKIYDIQMMLCGGVCNVNAVMAIKRVDNELGYVHLFHFVRKTNGYAGLDKQELNIINNVIFNYLKTNIDEALMKEFRQKRLESMRKKQEIETV